MTKVYMKTQLSGSRDGQVWPERGGSITVSQDEADGLVTAGVASLEPVSPREAGPMTTGAEPVESAAVDTEPKARRK